MNQNIMEQDKTKNNFLLPTEIEERTIYKILDKILENDELIEIQDKIKTCSGLFTKKLMESLLKELIAKTACYSLELYNDHISNYINYMNQVESVLGDNNIQV